MVDTRIRVHPNTCLQKARTEVTLAGDCVHCSSPEIASAHRHPRPPWTYCLHIDRVTSPSRV